jgi:hypothetical protein
MSGFHKLGRNHIPDIKEGTPVWIKWPNGKGLHLKKIGGGTTSASPAAFDLNELARGSTPNVSMA